MGDLLLECADGLIACLGTQKLLTMSKMIRLVLIRFLCLALTVNTIFAADSPGLAKGLVVIRATASESPSYYTASLFLKPVPAGAWIEYDIGQTKPLRLERGQVVEEIDLQPVFYSDFLREEHVKEHQSLLALLSKHATRSPKIAPLVKAVSAAIEENIRQFRGGYVRSRGVWMSSGSYADSLQRDEESAEQAIERRRNVRADYVPVVAKALLADYEMFTFRAGTLGSLTSYGDKTNVSSLFASFPTQLGKIDAGLKERSKPLPASYSLNIQAGIYPGDSPDGPAVLWATKGEDFIALDVGVCFKYSQATQELLNTRELEQAKFFLAKFDETLFETMVDAIATSKIKAILSPVTLNDDFAALQKKFYGTPAGGVKNESVIMIGRLNTKKGEFTILQKTTARYKAIILVGKPATLADGTVRQFVIAQLR